MSRLSAKDWDDAADLFEQGAEQARMSAETHTAAARKYAAARMDSLAMFATKKARLEEERSREAAP
jgi:hypothetical protein